MRVMMKLKNKNPPPKIADGGVFMQANTQLEVLMDHGGIILIAGSLGVGAGRNALFFFFDLCSFRLYELFLMNL